MRSLEHDVTPLRSTWSIGLVDPATDMTDVQFVLDDVADWLAGKGIDQWPAHFGEEGGRRMVQLRAEAERGHVYLARYGDQPMGTVTVTDWADPDFSAAWPGETGDARYVMRLASRRAARALREPGAISLGALLLNIAAGVALLDDARYLRLDCSRANTKLHAYYVHAGFRPAGTVRVPGRRSGALFQLDLHQPLAPLPVFTAQ
jgi:hypothetical protein